MEGWKLNEAEYKQEFLSEDDIWRIFNFIFSTRTQNTTTYKFAFLKSLIECIFDTNIYGEIGLDVIFERFTRIYWSLIIKHKLIQCRYIKGKQITSVDIIFNKYIKEVPELVTINFDNISDKIRRKIAEDVLKEGKKYVVGALYGDTNGYIYSFSKKLNYLRFNPLFLVFIQKFSTILLKANYIEWISFLEKINPVENCYSIAAKLHDASKRGDLKIYKDFLYYNLYSERCCCFFCGKTIRYEDIHVDHFIPWSFIKNDRLWNFEITCSKCNLSKSDKLASEGYLNRIIERDNSLVKSKGNILIQKDFQSYSENKMRQFYRSAEFCGFESWSFINHKEIIEVKNVFKS